MVQLVSCDREIKELLFNRNYLWQYVNIQDCANSCEMDSSGFATKPL